MDPWERYQSQSMLYGRWWGENMWTFLPATVIVGEFLETVIPSYSIHYTKLYELCLHV